MTASAVKLKETFTLGKVIGKQWQVCLNDKRSSQPKENGLQTSLKIHWEI